MMERYSRLVSFWRGYVFRYSALWGLVLALQLLFFAVSGVVPFFFKRVIDALTVLDRRAFLVSMTVYQGMEVLQAFLLYARGYAIRRLELKVQQDLQIAVYRRFHTMPYEQALRTKTGEALQRLTSEAITRNFSGRTIVVFSHDPLVLRYCQAVVDLAAAQEQG